MSVRLQKIGRINVGFLYLGFGEYLGLGLYVFVRIFEGFRRYFLGIFVFLGFFESNRSSNIYVS